MTRQSIETQQNLHPHEARILLVDDHPIVRQGLRMVICREHDLAVCGEASGMAEAMRAIETQRPDLVIIDLSLRDVSGIELIKRIRSEHPKLKMLVSSIHDEQFYAERVLHAGALGYVHKQESPDVIIQAIRTVLKGGIYLSKGISEQMLRQAVSGEPMRGRIEHLSDRELEVLELIGRGLGTAEIAKRLYLSPKTIDTYREHLKTKLNLRNSVELVRYAVQWDLEQTGL